MLLSSQLAGAYDELSLLVPELQSDPSTDPRLLADARESLANAKYYITWPTGSKANLATSGSREIQASRQTFRLLAEEAAKPADKERHQHDLDWIDWPAWT